MYLERVNPRKSAKWVPPPPEEMSRIRKEAGTDIETAAQHHGSSDDETLARPSGVTDGGNGHKKEENAGAMHRE